jgi:hypothetical protein
MGATPRKLKPPDDEDEMTIHNAKIDVDELARIVKRAASEDERELRLAAALLRRAAREFDPENLPPDLARQAVRFWDKLRAGSTAATFQA